jgi:glycosyltransferase involved in cell wall biosynthesis
MASLGRLVVATPLYPPDLGGPATYAHILAEHLPPKGVTVDVVHFGSVRHLPKLIRHVAYFFAVLSAARKADAVLALDPVSVGLPACIAARIRGKQFFVKVVGDYAWEQGRQRFGVKETLDTFITHRRVSLPVRFLRMVQTYVVRHAKRVLVPSFYLRRVVVAWGIPEKDIVVVYNAIEAKESGDCPSEMDQARRPLVLFVGRLVPWKHVDRIIEAVHSVTEQGIPATLLVVGSGPDERALQKQAAKSKGAVLFLGSQSPEATQRILAEADMLVLNSSYEGLSHVLIEALALGKAIIATDAGGNSELITDGVNGIVIPVGDTGALASAIVRLSEDSELRTLLERGARSSCESFTVDAMVEGTLNALV